MSSSGAYGSANHRACAGSAPPAPQNPRRPRLPAAVGAIWGLVLLGSACDPDPPAPSAPPAASLISTTGTVLLGRGGGAEEAATPGPLLLGDVLITRAGSTALVRGNDGRELELGESARLRIDAKLKGVSLELQEG